MLYRALKTLDRMLWAQPAHMYENSEKRAPSIDVVELEQRVMYSAVPFIDPSLLPDSFGVDDINDSASLQPEANTGGEENSNPEDALVVGQGEDSEDAILLEEPEISRELVFLDQSIENSSQILDDILNNAENRYLEIVYLDSERGLEQVSQQLPTGMRYDAIHFITHGTAGGVNIGNTLLTNDSLVANAGMVAGWSNYLNADADILFYGCDLASGEGELLVDSIAALCDCNVAASDDLTGHEGLGGDWEFEYVVGVIDTDLVVSDELQSSWVGTLDITSDLLLHNTFDTDASDSSGNGYDGTLVSSAAIDTTSGTNLVGGGKLSLNGSTDYVDLSAHVDDFDNLTEGTISAWFYADTLSGYQTIFEASDSGDDDSYVWLGLDGDELSYWVGQGNSTLIAGATTTANFTTGGWNHVAVTVGTTGNKLYVNGTELAVSYTDGSSSSNEFFDDVTNQDFMGWGVDHWDNSNFTEHFDGFIDDGRVYSRELSATDIGELFALGSNSAPGLSSIESAALDYTENDGAISITAALVIADSDDTNLESAVVQITGNYVNGEDLLSFTDQNGISGTWDAVNGELQLSGTSSVANYQAALRSVTYTNLSEDPSILSRTVSFSANDGDDDSGIAVRTIDVTAENDDPTLTIAGSASYIENQSPQLLEPTAVLADIDSANFNLGTMTISFSAGGTVNDRLAIRYEGNGAGQVSTSGSNVLYGGITVGTFTGGTDGTTPLVVTWNSNATATIAQAVLNNVTYENVSHAPSVSRTYEVALTDGDGGSVSSSGSLTLTRVNDAPVINSLGGDSLAASNDGTVYDLDTNISLTLSDLDLAGDFDGGSVTVIGNSFDVNDLIRIDTSGSITLSAGYADGSIVSVSGTAIGTLSGVSDSAFVLSLNAASSPARIESFLQELTFQSTSPTFGSRTVDVIVNDGDGTANGGTESTMATVNVFVTNGANGSVSVDEDNTYTFVATDFDFTGTTGTDLNSITVTSLPSNGTLRLNGSAILVNTTITKAQLDLGQFTFDPAGDENGINYADFDFYLNGGNATVSVLAGEANSFTLNGGALSETDSILADSDNFGVGGTVNSAISVVASTTTIDAAYLSQGSVLFNGYVPDGNWTAGELSTLDTWVQAGGILISTSDRSTHDDVNSYFGLTVVSGGDSDWDVADQTSPIMNGPFGLVGTNGSSFSASGIVSYFDSASLSPGDQILATDSVSGEPTIVLRAHGSGHILFTSDEGIFRSSMTGSGDILTANDRLAANVFAWAVDQVPPSASYTMDIHVDAVNDDPFNSGSLPGDISVTEDIASDVDLSAIDFGDIDAGSGAMTVTLTTSTGGNISAASSAGITIGGTAIARTISGSLADLNSYFDTSTNITYIHGTANTNGDNADSIQVEISDNGNVGSGGGGNIDLGSVNVDIAAMNDAPVVTAPGSSYLVDEQTGLSLEGTGFSVTDIDAFSGTLTATFSVTEGQITVVEGDSGSIVVSGNGSSSVSFSGTLAQLNALITGTSTGTITYLNPSDEPANNATVTLLVNDGGNTGADPGLTGDASSEEHSANQIINITAQNDDPVNAGSLPTDVSVLEDVLSNIDLSAIDISDADHGGSDLNVTLTTAAGNLFASTSGGVTVGGTSTAMTFTGTQANLNSYFDIASNIQYRHPTANTNGDNADSIQVEIRDNGNTGVGGGANVNLGSVNVDITARNDTPVVTAPGSSYLIDEQTGLTLEGTGFSVADVDALSGTLTATFTVTEGQITLVAGDSGAAVVSGNGSSAVSFSGTLAQLNALITGTSTGTITYVNPNDEPASSATVTLLVNDGGNTGIDPGLTADGSSEEHSANQIINVTAINDDPTNTGTLPTDLTVSEDLLSNLDLSTIDISDPDHNGGDLTVTLTTVSGDLYATTSGGVTVAGTSTAMTLTGTQANLNAFLNGASNVRYLHPTSDINGNDVDSVTVEVRDNGNTGSGGGGDVIFGTINIDITAINDDPVNLGTLPSDVSVTEDVASPVDLTTINLADVDHAGGTITLKIDSSTGGRLYASSGGGVTVFGSGSTSLWLDGDLSSLNAYISVLSNVTYQHSVLNTTGNDVDSLAVSINDNGNSGVGGGTDISLGNVNIDISDVNDAPNAMGETFGTAEDTPISGNVLANDSDPETDPISAVLVSSTSNGSLVLNADGTFNYSPNLDFFGTDEFVYRVTDGFASSLDVTTTISVAPVNDAPLAVADSYSSVAGETISILPGEGLLGNDLDVDGDSLSVVLISGTPGGVLVLNPDGSFSYTPTTISADDVTFVYAITDGNLQSAPVTVTITQVAPPPVIDPEPIVVEDDGDGLEEETEEEELEELLSEFSNSASVDEQAVAERSLGRIVSEQEERVETLSLEIDDETRTRVKNVESREFEFVLPEVANGELNRLAGNLTEFDRLAVDYDVEQLQITLDSFQKEVESVQESQKLVSGAVGTLMLGATAGTAIWMTSSSYLVAMISSSMPAWAGFDPIYVVRSRYSKGETDNQSLGDLISEGVKGLAQ